MNYHAERARADRLSGELTIMRELLEGTRDRMNRIENSVRAVITECDPVTSERLRAALDAAPAEPVDPRHEPAKEQQMSEPPVVIWSGEHKAFWCKNAAGYTRDAAQAGRYSIDVAMKHINGAGPEKRLEIIPASSIPVPDPNVPGAAEIRDLCAQLSELQEELARKDQVISDLRGRVDQDEPYVTDRRKEVLRRDPDLAHTHEVRRLLNEVDHLRSRAVVLAVDCARADNEVAADG